MTRHRIRTCRPWWNRWSKLFFVIALAMASGWALSGCGGNPFPARTSVFVDETSGCRYLAQFSSDGTWGKFTKIDDGCKNKEPK